MIMGNSSCLSAISGERKRDAICFKNWLDWCLTGLWTWNFNWCFKKFVLQQKKAPWKNQSKRVMWVPVWCIAFPFVGIGSGCQRAPSAAHHSVHISNDHKVHNDYSTQNNSEDHSTHTTNVTNITMQLLPYNAIPYPAAEWEKLFENTCLKTIEKLLGFSLSDPAAALLACLRFQHLNADMPQRQTVRIKEGQMEQYGLDRGNMSNKSTTWLHQELDEGLRKWLCRRRQDFYDVQGSLEQKMNKKPYEHLVAELDKQPSLNSLAEVLMDFMAGEMRQHCQRVLTPVREIRLNAVDPRGGILMLEARMMPPTLFAADVSITHQTWKQSSKTPEKQQAKQLHQAHQLCTTMWMSRMTTACTGITTLTTAITQNTDMTDQPFNAQPQMMNGRSCFRNNASRQSTSAWAADRTKSATWIQVPIEEGLKELLSRRRTDFYAVEDSLQGKINKKPFEHWMEYLDILDS